MVKTASFHVRATEKQSLRGPGPDTPRLAGVLDRWRPRSGVGTG